MSEHPDLSQPIANDGERAALLAELLTISADLERWRDLAALPDPLSNDSEADRLLPHVPGDSPQAKLKRWAGLFNDELQAVLDARNRVVHGIRVGDRELRGASWLARRLLELVTPAEAA